MEKVLIVGAGPVGLTLACELARYRIGVRLIDRAPRATQTSKALVVWSRTLELMDRMGCTEAFLAAGLRARGATLRAGGRVLGGPDFSDIASPYAFGLMIPQRDTERLLAEHLGSFGVTVEREVELLAFAQTPDGVEARLSHADGRQESVTTPSCSAATAPTAPCATGSAWPSAARRRATNGCSPTSASRATALRRATPSRSISTGTDRS